jgi:hypothetical protein
LSFGYEKGIERIRQQSNFLFWWDVIFARFTTQNEWPEAKSKFKIFFLPVLF